MIEHTVYFDNSPQLPEEKIAKLVIKFRKKHKVYPTECLALPAAIGDLKKVGLVEVKPKLNALVHHFWIGRNDQTKARI